MLSIVLSHSLGLPKQAKHSRPSLSMQGAVHRGIGTGRKVSVLGITGIKVHAASDTHDICVARPASVYVIESAA